MRKTMSLIGFLFFVFIFISPSLSQAESGTTYEVGTDQLNVRSSPMGDASVVGALYRGDKVTIFQEKYGWGQTYINDKEAWVAMPFLIKVGKTKTKKQATASSKSKTTVIADGVRLRSGPSTSHTIVGFQQKGDTIQVIQTKGDWHQVKLSGGKTAWIAAWLTSNQVNQSTSNSSPAASEPASAVSGSLVGKTIILDPGHGGYDPGSTALNGIFEKQLTLDISRVIAEALREKGAEVLFTRGNDRYVSLYDRVRISNAYDTDAFISVHFNAYHDKQINGISTHYYGGNKDYQLANAVQQELIKQTGLNNRGVQPDNYYVLRENSDPSILLELGFLTNQTDLNYITSSDYHARVGQAVANGLIRYFQ